jgi:uncharacterized integral membrane protein
MKPKIIIILVLIVLSLVILLQNTEVVEFKILFWKLEMSRIILISFVLISGFIVGYLVAKLEKKREASRVETVD